MIKSINAILISSKNTAKLIEFYQTIGFDLKMSDHGGGIHAETDFGDVHFAIWDGGTDAVEKSNVAFSVHVPELEAAYESLTAKGIKFDHPPQALPFGGIITQLRDPDGNRVIMMRWAPRDQ